jgi:iron(III) transport system substrate-binding protein
MKKYLLKITLTLTVCIMFSCDTAKEKSDEINIYSQRHYAVDELQYENFTKQTGIKVNVTKANADELIQRM